MIGVLLLNLGGPDSLGAVRPFLYNLFSDRNIISLGPPFLQRPLALLISSLRAKKSRAAYGLIGGKSPLLEITTAQAQAVEEILIASSAVKDRVKVSVGMRYWHPLIEDAVAELERAGCYRLLGLNLYPQYSIATTGSSMMKFSEAAGSRGIQYDAVTTWCDYPPYIKALVARIREGMGRFQRRPVVLFSAHSLPQRFIDAGDPYPAEIGRTIAAVAARLDMDWHLSYQSKTGPVKWLEPSTEHMLKDLAGRGIRDLLVVPVSFVSDHIETLYEIDIIYRAMALRLGINLQRIESLNTADLFIEALVSLVTTNLKQRGWT